MSNQPLCSDSIIKPFKDHIDGLIGIHGAASTNGACENRFMQLKHHILKKTPLNINSFICEYAESTSSKQKHCVDDYQAKQKQTVYLKFGNGPQHS